MATASRALKLALVSALFAVPLVVACSSAEEPSAEPAESAEAPIITGTADTAHPAVVLLQIKRGPTTYAGCTGTMIATNPATKIGYILTAGHCVTDAISISTYQTNDLASASPGSLGYAYLDSKAHPQYLPNGPASSPYDVAIVRVLGVDATTPVMPVLAPDQMVNGTKITSVGFGQTTRPGGHVDAGPSNTKKNRIDGVVSGLSASQMSVRYENSGDICHGDSGGPAVTTVNGKDFVAGVHSFVTGNCIGDGYSVRASSQVAFYNSIINQAAPAETCALCKQKASAGNQVCAQNWRTCLADPQCNGLRQCLTTCSREAIDAGVQSDAGSADECRKACSVEFPFGAAPYNTLVGFCACNECETACAGDTTCASVPKCGMKLGTDAHSSCNTCLEGSCCAQESACGADGHCYRCTKNPETPGCDTDALYQSLNSCKAGSCGAECTTTP